MQEKTVRTIAQASDFDALACKAEQHSGPQNTSQTRLSILFHPFILVLHLQPHVNSPDGSYRGGPEVSDGSHCATTPFWRQVVIGKTSPVARGRCRVFFGRLWCHVSFCARFCGRYRQRRKLAWYGPRNIISSPLILVCKSVFSFTWAVNNTLLYVICFLWICMFPSARPIYMMLAQGRSFFGNSPFLVHDCTIRTRRQTCLFPSSLRLRCSRAAKVGCTRIWRPADRPSCTIVRVQHARQND